MCGFLAEFCFNHSKPTDVAVFSELLALSKHRGPDATEQLRHTYYQLGFNRLSILDISPKGNQPKSSPSGRYQLVFNGEIYNFKELISTYQLTNLASTSDTEVIVHLLDVIGVEKTISVLNGMFAVAVVDTDIKQIYISRDFAGIKPLFYGVSEHGLVAASQFDQLFKHAWFKGKLQLFPEGLKDYFGLGYMQAPYTIYQSIFQVKPGELIQIDHSGSILKTRMTEFSKTKESKTSQQLEPVLISAVNRQLVSDVPLASFLSGGIDSPLISAYAKKRKPDLVGFTLEVTDRSINESDIAKAYADNLAIDQQIVTVNSKALLDDIDAHFKAFSEPFGDYSSIPTYAISKAARKEHTVMLSGDGGDELFYGYPRMRDVLRKAPWFKWPLWLRKSVVRLTNRLKLTNTYAPYLKSFNQFVLHKHLHIPREVLDSLLPSTNFSDAVNSLYKFKNKSRIELSHQLRWNEFYAHLQRILIKVDRASMGNSLEVRVPFLDKKMIDFSWQLENALISKSDLKKELKTALGKEVPVGLINQKKMGFTVPINQWLRNELESDVKKHLLSDQIYGNELLNATVLKNYVNAFYKGEHDNGWGIWHLYAWQKWAITHQPK